MVFAINPVQTSAKNFTAFQNVAEANGTALAAETSPTTATTTVSGASTVKIGGASVTLLIAALIGSLL